MEITLHGECYAEDPGHVITALRRLEQAIYEHVSEHGQIREPMVFSGIVSSTGFEPDLARLALVIHP